MALPDDITEVLEARLGVASGLEPRGFERLKGMARHFGRRGTGGEDETPEEILELAQMLGFEAEALEREAATLNRLTDTFSARPDLIPTIGQAVVRAITRVVTAEAEAIRMVLREVPPEQRARGLDQALAAMLPLQDQLFAMLHRVLLREPLAGALEEERLAEPAVAPVAIAHVDVVGSTVYLQDAHPGDTELLVDVLFAAAQTATLQGQTAVVKYVGDGVFLAGPDPADVTAAALDTIAHIQSALPVEARGGIAYGPVVRRAGDYFGLPVSLAELLTKEAEPGGLLATVEAAESLTGCPDKETVRVRLPRSRRRIDAVRVGKGGTAPKVDLARKDPATPPAATRPPAAQQ